ncbi:hypothetical protein [Neobacillus sp. D3-1R]|uniref:hypothetical protein n=1 Tax=Neobacillus sp. D3-1R TaxID=3445778 RepID=UPI003F9F1FF6
MDEKNRHNLPDFDSLDDRMIARQPSSPMLVIKTNLDPKDVTEENPYLTDEANQDKNKFRNFFEGDS